MDGSIFLSGNERYEGSVHDTAERTIWNDLDEEEVLRRKRAAYKAVLRQKRKKKRLWKVRLILAGLVLFVALAAGGIIFLIVKLVGAINQSIRTIPPDEPAITETEEVYRLEITDPEPPPEEALEEQPKAMVYSASEDGEIASIGDDVIGSYVVLIDKDNASVMAGRGYRTRINPASMTKVLTLLVAVEHMEESELSSPFTLTFDMTNYAYVHDCSTAGFAEGETVTVKDLLYGTILPSGGDAAVALACYIAGSQEAFVELMNEKLSELGLSESAHFTNCVGLYDEDHYCTPYDMAMIMWAAMDNELCRKVLGAKKYTTTVTEQHPEGIILSNWFLRRIEDKYCGLEVTGGKTGFVNESGNCAVSHGTAEDGREYICVVAGSTSAWKCIYDHVAIYRRFFDPDYVPVQRAPAEEETSEDEGE